MYEGESIRLKVRVVDANFVPVNISGASLAWEVQRDILSRSGEVISKTTTSGISITSASGGLFRIDIDPSDTEGLSGDYYHEARLADVSGNVSTLFVGRMTIIPTAIG